MRRLLLLTALIAVLPATAGSTGRNPGLPDYSDFIVVDVPGVG